MVVLTDKGLYCPEGNFFIDPWGSVDKAIITHAHADHAKEGQRSYLCHPLTSSILKCRIGSDISTQTIEYNQPVSINGVKVTLYPAGHIIGSSQVLIEGDGGRWVISGDYKLENDGISTPFEPVKCDHFITESTFGLPIYHWESQNNILGQINQWWKENQAQGKTSVIFAYSLGKAQRIIQNVDSSIGKIFVHGAVWNIQEAFKTSGIALQKTYEVGTAENKKEFQQSLIVAPPSALGTPWLKKFSPYSTAIASGWMQIRGSRRRRAVDRGFVLSDHADWEQLLEAVHLTGAENIYVTHGFKSTFSRHLREKGLNAVELDTLWEGEQL